MKEGKADFTLLTEQYRMKPEISHFPSKSFYESKIQDGANVQSPKYGRGTPLLFEGRPYAFLQVEGDEEQGDGGSWKNASEAKLVVDLVEQLRDRSSRVDVAGSPWHSTKRIRIITFYQAQVGEIKNELNRLEPGLADKVLV